MDLAARHIGFVLASYAVAFVLLSGLIVFLVVRMRAVKRRLAALEAQGARRRRAARANAINAAEAADGGPAVVESGQQEASAS